MKSLQEIFDQAVGGVLRQGCRASAGGTCAYRVFEEGQAPLACGIGQLIPDNVYHPHMEIGDISRLISAAELGTPTGDLFIAAMAAADIDWRDDTTQRLMARIQFDHDNCYDMDDYADRAADTAMNFGLSTSVITGSAS